MREGNWKLHVGNPARLYDLAKDQTEMRDVAAENVEVVKRLTKLAEGIRGETGVSLSAP